jgi:NAD(P)-dependent dehydrogenase (short-subunit alcohol dehydrogenase family)
MGRGGGTVVAIVTGGSRGLGWHIAGGLAADGHKLAIIHQGPGVGTDWLEIPRCDVSNEADVQRAVEMIVDTFGQIDILVNNAAVYAAALVDQTELSVWNECIGTGLTGAFLMTKHVLPIMQRQGYGRIVNIGSFGGQLGPAGAVAYNTAKAGLVGLTKTTANESAKYGITCNLVAAGCIDVGIYSRFSDRVKDKLLKLSPTGRAAIPDEVVWPVRWLCSPEASYITGQTLGVDGGIGL